MCGGIDKQWKKFWIPKNIVGKDAQNVDTENGKWDIGHSASRKGVLKVSENVTIIRGKVSVIMDRWSLFDEKTGEEFSIEKYLPRFKGKKVKIVIREED